MNDIPFNTDRPDQSNTPWIVPVGALQLETGIMMEKNFSRGKRVTNYSINNTLLKYGLNEFCEIRLKAEYLNTHNHITGYNINGFNALAVGLKIKLANGKGLKPQAAFLTHLMLKSENQNYAPDNSAMDITLCFSHEVLKKWSLSHNWGTQWDGEKPEMIFFNTLSIGYNLNSRLSMFIENYNFYSKNEVVDYRMDGGLTFDVRPNLKLDLSGGIGLREISPDYFISTGASFRFLRNSSLPDKLDHIRNVVRAYNIGF